MTPCDHVIRTLEALEVICVDEDGVGQLFFPYQSSYVAALIAELAHEASSPRMAALTVYGTLVSQHRERLIDIHLAPGVH